MSSIVKVQLPLNAPHEYENMCLIYQKDRRGMKQQHIPTRILRDMWPMKKGYYIANWDSVKGEYVLLTKTVDQDW